MTLKMGDFELNVLNVQMSSEVWSKYMSAKQEGVLIDLLALFVSHVRVFMHWVLSSAEGYEYQETFYPAAERHQNFCTKNPERYEASHAASGRDEYFKSVWSLGSAAE